MTLSPNQSIALDTMRGDGATIDDVCERIGGDRRNSVRAVKALVRDGLLAPGDRRMTRGRPVVYRQTERGCAEWKGSLR